MFSEHTIYCEKKTHAHTPMTEQPTAVEDTYNNGESRVYWIRRNGPTFIRFTRLAYTTNYNNIIERQRIGGSHAMQSAAQSSESKIRVIIL